MTVLPSARRRAVRLAAVACVAATRPAAAQPTTITFNEISLPSTTAAVPVGTPYVSQGYGFGCVNSNDGSPCSSLTALATGSAAYTGTPALFNNNIYGITTLARQDGAAFDLLSIDMSPYATGSAYSGPVVFEGILAGGGIAAQTFTIGSTANVLSTFVFSSAFRGLLSARFRGGSILGPFTGVAPQFDNVVVQPTATVPEPSTLVLLAAGLGGGFVVRRRRTRAG